MYFLIKQEDAKKILGVFYNSQYAQVVPYVEIMHNLKESEDGVLTFKEILDIEQATVKQSQEPENSLDGKN